MPLSEHEDEGNEGLFSELVTARTFAELANYPSLIRFLIGNGPGVQLFKEAIRLTQRAIPSKPGNGGCITFPFAYSHFLEAVFMFTFTQDRESLAKAFSPVGASGVVSWLPYTSFDLTHEEVADMKGALLRKFHLAA